MLKIYTANTSLDGTAREVTVIFVGDYIRYRELESVEGELLESQVSEFVVLAGKMPSWYALAIASILMRRFNNVKVLGIYRPPADKVLIVYSEDETLPVNSWVTMSKKLTEFCRSGQLYA